VEDENAVQVLDPETFVARSVARPSFFDPDAVSEGETVPAVKFDDEVFLLPEESVDEA